MNDSLPYEIIARWNGLVKELPDDPSSWTWVDANGNKFIETNLGFVPSTQFNWKLQLDKIQNELESVSSDYLEMKKKYELLLTTHKPVNDSVNKIGRGSKRTLRKILDAELTADEKVDEIRNYLTSTKLC